MKKKVAKNLKNKPHIQDKQRLSWMSDEDYGIPKGFWLYLGLVLLTLYALYTVVLQLVQTGRIPLTISSVGILDSGTSLGFIVVFSVLFFSLVVRKAKIPFIARLSAYFLVIVASLALAMTLWFSSKDNFDWIFFLVFHNPITSACFGGASILGIITIVITLIWRRYGQVVPKKK